MCVLWWWEGGGGLTFRKLLNCPTGDARRQAPQVEANGCTLNYLEWDRRFCKRWVHCVGGGSGGGPDAL